MSIWSQVGQRLQAPARCITTATTTTRAPKRKTREYSPPAPHPPFDITHYTKSKSQTDILGLNKPTHRLAPPEVIKAALARAQSTGGAILQTLKIKRDQPRPRQRKAAEARVANAVENTWTRSPPPWKRKTAKRPHRRPNDSHSTSRSPNTFPHHTGRLELVKTLEKIVESGGNETSIVEGWGEDKLRPPTEQTPPSNKFASSSHQPAPHIRPPRNPLFYERRIEGLLDPSNKRALEDLKPTSKHLPIAQLAHGLDRVLFNPGVHWLQDPRSRVYNFPPYLENIPKVTDFAFERLSGFIKSSRDEDLWDLAKRENRTFAGSTSSLTGMLSQIYFLISGNKDVDTSVLSRVFAREPTTFTPGQRMPSSVLFNYNDGVYAIDSAGDSALADKNILTWLGTLLEKFITMAPEEFSTYMRSEVPPPVEGEQAEEPMREAYRYAKSERFVMRSQLDCEDKRLPGTGVFDVKTRACLPIRLDMLNFEENSGYLIRKQHGIMESFEREYYDLIRSAFLKYSFQVRIGNMDGVIVAYHNTARMFGFQYIALEEMDQRLFGSTPGVGDRVFDKCVGLMEHVADEVVRCFPQQSVICTFETGDNKDVMNVWVEPAEWTSDEPRPIKQLEVRVENYIEEDPVRGSFAVTSGGEAWTTHWSVARLSGKDYDPRESLAGAKGRQFRAHNIPTGVDHADLAEFWNGLDFGGKAKLAQVTKEGKEVEEVVGAPYVASHFRKASDRLKKLRGVARRGREDTERWREEERGKPMWVLGETEPVPRDVVEAVLEARESDEAVGEIISEDEEQEGEVESEVRGGEPEEDAQPDLEGVELERVIDAEPKEDVVGHDELVESTTFTSGGVYRF